MKISILTGITTERLKIVDISFELKIVNTKLLLI